MDVTSGLDLFPTLRLLDNDGPAYAASMSVLSQLWSVLSDLQLHDAVLSLHRFPENNFSPSQTKAAFQATLQALVKATAPRRLSGCVRRAL